MGYPLSWDGVPPSQVRMGVPQDRVPPALGWGIPRIGKQKEYLLRGGRYASCVHAGEFSCLLISLHVMTAHYFLLICLHVMTAHYFLLICLHVMTAHYFLLICLHVMTAHYFLVSVVVDGTERCDGAAADLLWESKRIPARAVAWRGQQRYARTHTHTHTHTHAHTHTTYWTLLSYWPCLTLTFRTAEARDLHPAVWLREKIVPRETVRRTGALPGLH